MTNCNGGCIVYEFKFSDAKISKPPVLSPKPDVLVKRFSFNKQRKSDTESTSSASSSPAIGKKKFFCGFHLISLTKVIYTYDLKIKS